MSVNGKYIYGFMRNGAKPTFTIPGIDGKPVLQYQITVLPLWSAMDRMANSVRNGRI